MGDDSSWHSEPVVVPDVVGLVVDTEQAGVVLAQPDPDGPPLSALTWHRPVIVLTQHPPAGTALPRRESVRVTWGPAEATGVREPRRPLPRPDDGVRKLAEDDPPPLKG